jgi:hypothetical protein
MGYSVGTPLARHLRRRLPERTRSDGRRAAAVNTTMQHRSVGGHHRRNKHRCSAMQQCSRRCCNAMCSSATSHVAATQWLQVRHALRQRRIPGDCVRVIVRVLHGTPVVVQSTLSLQAAYDRSASHLHGFINIVLDSHARAHARLSAYELQRGATRCCSIVPRIATCVS